MTAPQIILLLLLALDTGAKIAQHGKPRMAYNGYCAILDLCLFIGLLCWGGFFK